MKYINSLIIQMNLQYNKLKLNKISRKFGEFERNLCISKYDLKKTMYDITKVLANNKHHFCFVEEKCLSEGKIAFNEMYQKYVTLIKSIIDLDINSIGLTDNDDIKFFLETANLDKYDIISPIYIANEYCSLLDKNKDKNVNNRDALISKLKKDYSHIKKAFRVFNQEYNYHVSNFILNSPVDKELLVEYNIAFTTNLVVLVVEFCNSMINLNVYALPLLIENIVDTFTPPDAISSSNYIVL